MERETVTVIVKDTGSTIGIMSRKDAESMVAEDPALFAIRENPHAAALKTLGALGATSLLVEAVAASDAKARTPEQALLFEVARRGRSTPKSEQQQPSKSVQPEAAAPRDPSPTRRAPANIQQPPSGCDAFVRSGLEFVVSQYLQINNFRKLFSDVYVSTWTIAPTEPNGTGKYQFTAHNARAAGHIADTLRALGYANATPKKTRPVK